MAFSSGSPGALSATPNVTPLIDVLLVLLIIFMVIVPVSPYGLASQIPQDSSISQPQQERPPVILHVSADGTPHRVTYRLADHPLLPSQLARALSTTRSESDEPAILIDGDPALDFQAIASAVAAAEVAGFPSIGLLPRNQHGR